MNQFMKFVRAPLNQAALTTAGGAIWATLNGSVSWEHALPIWAGCLVAILIPDNTVAKKDIEEAVAAGVKAFQDVVGAPPAPTDSAKK